MLLRLSLIAALCVPAGARAEDTRPSVTVVLSGAEGPLARLRAALSKGAPDAVRLRFAALPAPRPAAPDPGQADVTERLASARQRYIDADFERCLKSLPDDDALHRWLAGGARELVGRVLLWRVACHVGAGQTEDARAQARAFATLGLPVPADVDAVTPEVEATLAEAQRWAATATRASLRVETTPPGLRVEVDGRPAGCVTPCGVGVVPGLHVVRVRGDGYVPEERAIEAAPDAPPVKLRARRAPPPLAAAQWLARYEQGSELHSAGSLSLLALALPARRLVLLEPERLRAGRYELRGSYAIAGEVAARAAVSGVDERRLEPESVALLTELLVRGQTVAARPLWRNPWFWAVVGAVAAAAATTTGLLVRERGVRTELAFADMGGS